MKKTQSGFSLLELLLVVGVGALLLLAGLATYRLVSEGNNVNAATQMLNTLKAIHTSSSQEEMHQHAVNLVQQAQFVAPQMQSAMDQMSTVAPAFKDQAIGMMQEAAAAAPQALQQQAADILQKALIVLV